MAGATLEYDDEDVLAAMRSASRVLGDPTPLLNSMGEYLLIAHRQRFEDQLSPSGVPWAALSPRYKQVKPKNKDRILYRDGYLANTLRYQVTAGSLLFGSNRATARHHHFGTRPYTITPRNRQALMWPGGPGPRKTVNHPGLPARPWLGTSEEDDRELLAIVQDEWDRVLGSQ